MEISYEQAQELLRKEINDEGILKHSKAVSDFLYKISKKLKSKHPDLDIDSNKLRIAGLLHDIGKNKGVFHAYSGAKILRKHNLNEIADLIQTHGVAKELAEINNISGNFEPKTMGQELLVYADAHVMGDRVISFRARFSDILKRAKSNPDKYRALEKGYKRVKKIVDKIDRLLR